MDLLTTFLLTLAIISTLILAAIGAVIWIIVPMREAITRGVLKDLARNKLESIVGTRNVSLTSMTRRMLVSAKSTVHLLPSGRIVVPAAIDIAIAPEGFNALACDHNVIIDDLRQLMVREATQRAWELQSCVTPHDPQHRHDARCAPLITVRADRLSPDHGPRAKAVHLRTHAAAPAPKGNLHILPRPTTTPDHQHARDSQLATTNAVPPTAWMGMRQRRKTTGSSGVRLRDPLCLRQSVGGTVLLELGSERGPAMIGRWRGAAVVLDDESMRMQHALLRPNGSGGWTIEPMDQNAPVAVNNRLIDQPTSVGAGDQLRLGTVKLTLSTKQKDDP